jgi:hypothetical protein
LENSATEGKSPVWYAIIIIESKLDFVEVFLNIGEPSSNTKYYFMNDSE